MPIFFGHPFFWRLFFYIFLRLVIFSWISSCLLYSFSAFPFFFCIFCFYCLCCFFVFRVFFLCFRFLPFLCFSCFFVFPVFLCFSCFSCFLLLCFSAFVSFLFLCFSASPFFLYCIDFSWILFFGVSFLLVFLVFLPMSTVIPTATILYCVYAILRFIVCLFVCLRGKCSSCFWSVFSLFLFPCFCASLDSGNKANNKN